MRSLLRLRRLATLVASGALAFAAVHACGGSRERRPVAALASSAESGAAFQQIRDAWVNPAHVSRADVRAMLERFLAKYPKDGLEQFARVLLAVVYMDAGELDRAAAQMTLLAKVPYGTTRDLVTTAQARWLRLHGQPGEAMKLLRPNVGKNVDPIARSLFQEELALAALASDSEHDQYEAISYMDAWLQGTTDEEREQTYARVRAIIAKMPREVLETALQIMRAQGGGYGAEIEHIVGERLAEIAIKDGDAELARTLLDSDGGAPLTLSGDAGIALSDLATSRRGMNVVEGRTIGLLLPTEDAALRDESADVLRGVLWALGKPKGIRQILSDATPSASTKVPSGGRDGGSADSCLRSAEAADPSLPVDEPKDTDGISLTTRDDSGSSDRTESSLDELAGQGAAIIIAALDPATADRVVRWTAHHDVPVILLAAPTAERPRDSTFVLGEPRANVLSALVRSVPDFAKSKVAPVVDASELDDFPAKGGTYGPLTLLPPASCDTPTAHAGDPRFPLGDWDKAGARAWLVTGSPSCARDVLAELTSRARGGVVGMTLEASGDFKRSHDLRSASAAAGVVPLRADVTMVDSELARFVAAYGATRMTWWTALGRDAATLARRAALSLPSTMVATTDAVAKRRDLARRDLASARARLWSTEARGFDGKSVVVRSICVL